MRRTFALALGLSLSLAAAPAMAEPTVVVRWNDAALDALAKNPPAPTAACWRLYVVSAAMFEAWAPYDEVAVGPIFGGSLRRPAALRTEENKREAVSQAAYIALSTILPAQEPDFRALLEELGYEPSKSRGLGNPSGLARRVTEAVLADRFDDGSNAANGFAPIASDTYPTPYVPLNSADPNAPNAPGGPAFEPNHWQPLRVPTGTLKDADGFPIADNNDPTTFRDQTFLSPHWGAVRPFALESGSQFRPSGPPQFGSQEPYTDALGNTMTSDQACHIQFDQVLAYNAALGNTEKVIAEFWADGPRTWTPPGHWNQLAHGISIRDNHTIDDDVKMFFALNGGMLDASIAVWECKRHYDLIRPISAIRDHHYGQTIQAWGGPNKGTVAILGQDFRPYQMLTFVTPPFPEYVSGHSTFSRTGREVLFAFAGTDAMYDGVTRLGQDYDKDGVEDYFGQHIATPGALLIEQGPSETVTLRWSTLLEAAQQAGLSRLYGGIHIQDGNLRGQAMGSQIGPQAFEKARSYWSGEAASAGRSLAAVGGMAGSGGEDGRGAPARGVSFALTSANPSSNGFQLRFQLPSAGPVRLEVFDPSGRRVSTVLSGHQTAGEHYTAWDGRAEDGRPVATGLYFLRLQTLGEQQVLKVATLN